MRQAVGWRSSAELPLGMMTLRGTLSVAASLAIARRISELWAVAGASLLFDASQLDEGTVGFSPFDVLDAATRRLLPAADRRVAWVHGECAAAAIVAVLSQTFDRLGAATLLTPSFEAARAHLGGAAFFERTRQQHEDELGAPSTLDRVRLYLARNPRAEIGPTAAHVGLAGRSLQRLLAGAGTTFRTERADTRAELAWERVWSGRAKLSVVAQEVGFASEAELSRAFRRAFGMPPSTLRLGRELE